MKAFLIALGLALALGACSSKNDDNKAAGTGGGGQGQTGCRAPVAEDNTTGGCRIRLAAPANCSSIDLSGGKTVRFEWTTDGTNCELPYKAYIAGNPVTRNADDSLDNVVEFQINARPGEVSNTGGTVEVNAEYFNQVTSTDGTYDWVISSFHGSRPESNVVKVQL